MTIPRELTLKVFELKSGIAPWNDCVASIHFWRLEISKITKETVEVANFKLPDIFNHPPSFIKRIDKDGLDVEGAGKFNAIIADTLVNLDQGQTIIFQCSEDDLGVKNGKETKVFIAKLVEIIRLEKLGWQEARCAILLSVEYLSDADGDEAVERKKWYLRTDKAHWNEYCDEEELKIDVDDVIQQARLLLDMLINDHNVKFFAWLTRPLACGMFFHALELGKAVPLKQQLSTFELSQRLSKSPLYIEELPEDFSESQLALTRFQLKPFCERFLSAALCQYDRDVISLLHSAIARVVAENDLNKSDITRYCNWWNPQNTPCDLTQTENLTQTETIFEAPRRQKLKNDNERVLIHALVSEKDASHMVSLYNINVIDIRGFEGNTLVYLRLSELNTLEKACIELEIQKGDEIDLIIQAETSVYGSDTARQRSLERVYALYTSMKGDPKVTKDVLVAYETLLTQYGANDREDDALYMQDS